jgi:hypothetical protein
VYLHHDPHSIDTFDILVERTVDVISWAADNGAKIFWIHAMRTALSTLFNYRFNKELSDNPIVKSIVHTCILQQLTVKEPLQLKWELPQLLSYIGNMPPNSRLSYPTLQRKCIVLVMVYTLTRFSEMQQFEADEEKLIDDEQEWRFIVRVKGKLFRQPIALHAVGENQIDPVRALKTLRQRMKRKKWITGAKGELFWRDEDGREMSAEQLREQVKLFLAEAGIPEHRPYHIKHATMTWLDTHGATSDDLRRLARHTHSSTAYTDFYLREDLGASCAERIAHSITLDGSRLPVTRQTSGGQRARSAPCADRRFLRSTRKGN